MAVIRYQKGGMVAKYKGVEVTSNCSSLSTGIEFFGRNRTIVASFSPEELKLMVKKAIKAHGVRKFALLTDNANGADMDLFLINPSTIVKYWDELLSLNTTGKKGHFEMCLRSTKNGRLFLNLYADKISNFVSKSQIIEAEGFNKGYKAEEVLFPKNGKKRNNLVDGYLIKRTKNGKSYRFAVQLKCSSNRANTNGIVKF